MENNEEHRLEAALDSFRNAKVLKSALTLWPMIGIEPSVHDEVLGYLEKLEGDNQALIEALKFYANAESWDLDRARTNAANYGQINAAIGVYTSIIDDTDISGVSLGHITNSVGGHIARESLKKAGIDV